MSRKSERGKREGNGNANRLHEGALSQPGLLFGPAAGRRPTAEGRRVMPSPGRLPLSRGHLHGERRGRMHRRSGR